MIQQVNPLIRLQVLQKYMAFYVQWWPSITTTFEQFFQERHPELIPGTKEHAKTIATHCYYCHVALSKTGIYNNQTPTIDHFEPKSKSRTQKFVIYCAHCNQSKGKIHPDTLARQFVNAEIKGLSVWGFSGKKLRSVSERVQAINNDRLWKMGPNIYFIQK